MAVPYFLADRINMQMNTQDIALGLFVTAIVLLPIFFLMIYAGSYPQPVPLQILAFQLFGISLPEEVYFRGFLQERIGNNIRGVILTSGLFAIMHLPQLVTYGDWNSLLTFFPSLVMGFLYMRTSNILPPVIFHYAANVLFQGFAFYRP